MDLNLNLNCLPLNGPLNGEEYGAVLCCAVLYDANNMFFCVELLATYGSREADGDGDSDGDDDGGNEELLVLCTYPRPGVHIIVIAILCIAY